MAGIDFDNQKGSNLGDPKFGQDATNLRTVKNLISGATNVFTANAISLQSLQFIQPITQPVPNSGLMWFSANTLYIYTGNTYSDLKAL